MKQRAQPEKPALCSQPLALRHVNGDPNALAEHIVAEIEAARYETTEPELTPIRRNPDL